MAVSKVILNGTTLIDTTDKTVTNASMLSGVTALKNDGTTATGNIASQAAQTIHPSATDQTIASGKYLTGAQTVKGVLLTNLTAGNIKKDVVVKVGDSTDDDCVTSVTGTYEGGSNITVESLSVTQNGTYTAPTGKAYSPVSVNVSGGGSNLTLLGSEEFTVSTTSTTQAVVGYIEIDNSTLSFGDIIWVHITDKAGGRNGYFYGNNAWFLYLGERPANANPPRYSIYYDNDKYTSTASGYGVYPYNINTSWEVQINSRYNSDSTKTIDGTYKCDVYKVSL